MKKLLALLVLALAAAATGCVSTQNNTQTTTATTTHAMTTTTTTTPPEYNLIPQKIITAEAINAERGAIQYVEIHDNTVAEHFRLERTAAAYEKDGTVTVVYNGRYERVETHTPETLLPTLVYKVNSENYVLFYDGYETLAAPVLHATIERTTVATVPLYVLDDDNLRPAGRAEILYTPVTTAATLTDLPTYINPQAVTTHHLQKFMDTDWTDITNNLFRRAAGETSTQEEKTKQVIVTFTGSPALTFLSTNFEYTTETAATTAVQYLYIVLDYTAKLEYHLTYNAPGTRITMDIDKEIPVPYLEGTTAYTEFYPAPTAANGMITFLWFTLTLPEDGHWTSTEYESGADYCYCYTTIRDIETP